jgi:histidine triad (HIT) family protein
MPKFEKTLFDKILDKSIPSTIVFENEHVLAFKDINPQAPVHVLVIPKQRARYLPDLVTWNPDNVGRFFQDVAEVAKLIGVEESGYRVVMNTKADGGQTVGYFHAHILAGRPLSGSFA